MDLKPSEIFYSQDSINNFFDKRTSHNRTRIGETLDDVCEGRCQISSIPTMTVVKRDGKWVTADNRRLWVFRELERLEKCDTIPVRISSYIPDAKMTSYNGGTSVRVRGPAGGNWHNKPTPHKPPIQSTMQVSKKASVYQSGYKVKDSSESPTIFSYKATAVYKAPTPELQYNININDSPLTGFGYTSIPTPMTTAPKTNVTVKTSPEHTPRLTIRSTEDTSRSNPTINVLHSTYKAPVQITPISYSDFKHPSFYDIGKTNDDHSHRDTHSSVSQYRDQSSYSNQVGSSVSPYRDQSSYSNQFGSSVSPYRDRSSYSNQVGSSVSPYSDQGSYSKQGGLSVSQDRDQHSSFSKQGAGSVSPYYDQHSSYSNKGSLSRHTVSRSDSPVDHSSICITKTEPDAPESHYDLCTNEQRNCLKVFFVAVQYYKW